MSESENDAEGDSSATSTDVLVFEVDEASMGIRVDAWIAELTGISRAQVRRWVDAGRVLVSGAKVRAS